MPSPEKKNLYTPAVYKTCLARINTLKAESPPEWGSMDAARMLSHCSEVIEVLCGKELKNTPFYVKLFKGMIRHMVVNDRPYPKNTKTHPQYVQPAEVDFFAAKQKLLDNLEQFHTESEEKALATIHPLFGRMSLEERGWSAYKHLDHHLMQFGV